MVFVERIENQLTLLKSIPFSGKFGGATGNFNAHHIAYQEIDCMDKILTFNDESNEAVEWFSNITCEKYCTQTTLDCNISTDEP